MVCTVTRICAFHPDDEIQIPQTKSIQTCYANFLPKGIILAFAAFTTLFSCQVFSPENGSTKADNEELIEKDLSHKEKTNSEAKSITESISESEKSTNEEPVLIQGISEDEGMQPDDMKMEREPEPTIGVVPIDDAVKCIGVSTMSFLSTLCASPTAPMTMTYDATDSYTSPAYTMEYKRSHCC